MPSVDQGPLEGKGRTRSMSGDSDPTTPLLQRVLELEIQLEVVQQRAEAFIRYRTKVTHHLTEVFLLEQAMLTKVVGLESQVKEAEEAYAESLQHPRAPPAP